MEVGPQRGGNDNAAGFIVCMDAVRMLIKLGLRPKWTLWFIASSREETVEANSVAIFMFKFILIKWITILWFFNLSLELKDLKDGDFNDQIDHMW
jgi:hypothetical protein